ncbi:MULTISPECIES: signal peptidase II [unclassified Pseudonocardia]|uniref:signal peptidase II n=1 Tax=unclassified Pseudonocardia TaxID=2619320 RepID=UPI001AD33F2C|nr:MULTISPECIES: signal peptidase II [unclassified Pseudonocardia]MBN9098004.1 signal peptidase II [Pseudonocardia sp.]
MVDADVPDPPSRPWKPLAVAGAVVIVVDQAAKAIALRALDEPVTILPGVALRLSFNTGAAFSTGTTLTPLITVVAVIAVLGIAGVARRVATSGWGLALGLIGGGAAGNLADRLLRPPGVGRGAVVDYIDVSWFAAFNLADVAITAGALLAVVLAVRGVPTLQARSARG